MGIKTRAVMLALALTMAIAACGGAPEEAKLPEPPIPPAPFAPEEPPAEEPPVETEPEQEPVPGAEPEPTPVDPLAARVEELLAGMTLREKVCQLFIVRPESLTGVSPVTGADEALRAGLETYPVGGIVLFAQNLETAEQTKALIDGAQSFSRIGLFVAVDEEGGVVNRLMNRLDTTRINSMYTYKDKGPETARANAGIIGGDIAAHGFNLDFAPVADVWSNPENTVIGRRAYSDDFAEAAGLVAAAVEGFHDAGVLCTLKHFPGHGDTAEDSHTGAAYVHKTREALENEEWLPFRAGIAAGSDLVMVGHLTVPALDEDIATVSRAMVTDILRGELGFEGVIITDSLEMSAAAALYEPGELAVRALEAGVDMLLIPGDLEAAVNALIEATDSGWVSPERLNESAARILALKLQYGIIE